MQQLKIIKKKNALSKHLLNNSLHSSILSNT